MKLTWLGKIIGTALIYCTFITPASADPPDFSICDGLSGAAWGLCRGGVAAGCADGTGNPTACMRIEENYRSVTGEDAPWITPPVTCPCDYLTDVPIATEWAVCNKRVFKCPGDTATFQAVLPVTPDTSSQRYSHDTRSASADLSGCSSIWSSWKRARDKVRLSSAYAATM